MSKINVVLDRLQDALGTVALSREGAQGDVCGLTYLQALQVEEALSEAIRILGAKTKSTVGVLETHNID